MTTNKNVEEIMKEFDENTPKWLSTDPLEPQYMIPDMKAIKEFILHAHNEGYKAGLEKAREMAGEKRKTDKYPQQLYKFGGGVEQFERLSDGDIHYNQAIADITSSLTQLITSNNEVDEK